MNDRDKALLAFAEATRDSVTAIGDTVREMAARFDAELADIRDGMVEMDHKLGRARALLSDHEERLTA